MVTLEWNEDYELKIDKIDEHHKRFLEIINLLINVTENRSCEEEISLVFFRLIFYVENYFIDEEIILKEYNCTNLKEHKEEHNKFVKEIIKFQNEYQKHDKTVCKRLLNYLQSWFNEHILAYDRKAAELILKNESINKTNTN